MKLFDFTDGKIVTQLAWTVSALAALKLLASAARYYAEQKRISTFFAKYPELFKGNLPGLWSHCSRFELKKTLENWLGWMTELEKDKLRRDWNLCTAFSVFVAISFCLIVNKLFIIWSLYSEYGIRVKNKACDELGVDAKGGYVTVLGPGIRIFFATQPEVAKFLMTLKPELVVKAGLSDILFGDDPNGFFGGLLYEEGPYWVRSRKIISEEFNQVIFYSEHTYSFHTGTYRHHLIPT